jgi:galactokinase
LTHLQAGDVEKIGMLIKQAQSELDKHLIPSCSQELTASIVHTLLNYSPIQTYIFGGKSAQSNQTV